MENYHLIHISRISEVEQNLHALNLKKIAEKEMKLHSMLNEINKIIKKQNFIKDKETQNRMKFIIDNFLKGDI